MITISNLYKSYGSQKVLNGLSIKLKAGETVGLLGINGAGKSTLIKILSGLIPLDIGSIQIDGQCYLDFFSKKRNKTKIGVVPQETALYQTLSIKQNLSFWAKVYGLSQSEVNEKIETYLQLLNFKDIEHKKVETLSIGQQKIISLLCGIIHDPTILFLDEPTVGIDIFHKEKIYSFIKELKQKGITIIYSTHNFSEIPKICDKIAILKEGKIQDFGTEDALVGKYNLSQSIEIQVEKEAILDHFPIDAFNKKGINIHLLKKQLLSITGKEATLLLPDILKSLYDTHIKVINLKINQPSLEHLFIQVHNS